MIDTAYLIYLRKQYSLCYSGLTDTMKYSINYYIGLFERNDFYIQIRENEEKIMELILSIISKIVPTLTPHEFLRNQKIDEFLQ